MSTSLQNIRALTANYNSINPDQPESADRKLEEPLNSKYDTINVSNLGKASLLSCVINLCTSSIGAALLGLPYAASKVGWVMSIIMLIIFSIISQWTFQLETRCGIKYNTLNTSLSSISLSRTSSYYNLSKSTNIARLEIVADITVFLNQFGACCAYLVIIGDLMPDAMAKFVINDNNILLNRRFWIIVYMVILIIPCLFLKKLYFLRFTSTFSILCFLFITICMILFFNDSSVNLCNELFIENRRCGLQQFINFNDSNNLLNFFKATPIYMFAFGSHPLAFSLINELLNVNNIRMNIVIILSFTMCTFYYIGIGLIGYWTFGNNVESNILNNYPQNSTLLFLVRICLSIALCFVYPVVSNPARNSLSTIIYKKNIDEISLFQFNIITIIIIILSLIIAMTVTDLGTVFGFIGSTSQPTAILILPGLFYYYYYYNNNTNNLNHNNCIDKLNKYISILSILIGIILIPLSLFVFFI